MPNGNPTSRSHRQQVHWLSADSSSAWDAQAWLWHGFTTRSGELNLGFNQEAHGDDQTKILDNRYRLMEAVTGRRDMPLATVRQVHSNRTVVIKTVSDTDAGPTLSAPVLPEADGMVTATPGLMLGILTADCVPVLIADPTHRAIGAFHAGWRGTVERVVEHGIGTMRKVFQSDPQELIAAIGPAIGPCCYTVGKDVLSRFETNLPDAYTLFSNGEGARLKTAEGLGLDLTLDLIEANRRQLLTVGLQPDSIVQVGACTSCHSDLYYSHRASRGSAGRMMAFIGIR